MTHMKRIILRNILPTLLICLSFSFFSSSNVQAAKSTYKKTAVTVNSCNLKKKATADSKTVCRIKQYEPCTAIQKSSKGWYKVKYKKKTGYVKESALIVGSNAKRLIKKVNKNSYKRMGTFKITAYCSCSSCCGKWAGSPTASGVYPKSKRTIAVDPKVIPLGTKIIINGNTYVAEDTGVRNKTIDIYMSSHRSALYWGVRYLPVYKQVDPSIDIML